MTKKILWVLAGLIGGKITNEILYRLFNTPSSGVNLANAAIPAIGGALVLSICFYKAFKKNKSSALADIAEPQPASKLVKVDSNSIGSPKNLLILCLGLVILGLLFASDNLLNLANLGSPAVYKVYGCKDPISNTENECIRELDYTAQFSVDKERNQVFVTYTDIGSAEKALRDLKNCAVMNSKNWKCGGEVTSEGNTLVVASSMQMIDGDVKATSAIYTIVGNGKSRSSSSIPPKFVKN